MDREWADLAVLGLVVVGAALATAGFWPAGPVAAATAREWERRRWRAVEMPAMKIVIFLVMVAGAVGGFYAYRHHREQAAIAAVISSLCEGELNDKILQDAVIADATYRAKNELGAGMAAVDIREKMLHSSMGPHYSTLQRMGGSIKLEEIKRIAAEVSARCPHRFATAAQAEKIVAYTIILSTPPAP